ncbi:MAG: protein-glutamate O-methyltransferase CheR [Bryobacteraceae bacterium]|nr:protein-glutamate O-methyltransferase CheR [Bryobacteraceae bacterium]
MATLVDNTAGPAKVEIHPDNYKFLQDYIYRESGIVIERDKHYLLEARLLPVAKKRELNSINDLCGLLRATAGPELKRQIVEAMTTHETLFFRDPGQFEALKKVVLPPLMDMRRTSKRITIWSAAASSGQESYSVAMMLLEMGLKDWNISITGTDLSEQILARAREGKFSQLEVNRGLPAPLLVKYFTRHGLDWQLKDEVRRMVNFRTFDLRKSMRTLGPFDIVLCRNVLIYFDQDTKKQILEEIRGTLQSGGYLLLGGAETTLCLADRFERIQAHGSVVYKVV